MHKPEMKFYVGMGILFFAFGAICFLVRPAAVYAQDRNDDAKNYDDDLYDESDTGMEAAAKPDETKYNPNEQVLVGEEQFKEAGYYDNSLEGWTAVFEDKPDSDFIPYRPVDVSNFKVTDADGNDTGLTVSEMLQADNPDLD